ncbi:Aste57867_1155 [Aphanomyces stellatus]|uniref:Aste57867_1155 protein n=1 Tax=Aphanomyces stellatus TaxID=120398 RepID=A0A485K8M5_9STRA|nr:hypothetical protein As57867_001154 [Aphanomyces stellatus]VFT78375.1 Aste57867_1155 [Aphanomyces stellatus]
MYQRQVLDGRGNSAVATRPIAAGACVLKCDPCSAVPLDMSTTCAYCFAPGARRCGLCKVMHYCSRPCQLADWAVHGVECKYLAAHLHANPMTPTLLLATRILRLPSLMGAVAHLVPNWDAHLASQREQYLSMGALVLSVLARMKPKTMPILPTLETAATLFAQLNCNAFTVCTLEHVPVGIGMYPEAALLNHSCAPNCIITFHKRQLQIRAIRPIPSGEELTVSYIELMATHHDRQDELRASYFFTCQCSRCLTPEPSDLTALVDTVDRATDVHLQVHQLEAMADEMEGRQETRGAVDARLRALALAQSIYGPRHVALTLAMETTANLITSTQHAPRRTAADMDTAAGLYTAVLANHSHVHGPWTMDAFRGLCTLKLARLLLDMHAFAAALPHARDACRLLSITHGDDASIVTDAVATLHEIQANVVLLH